MTEALHLPRRFPNGDVQIFAGGSDATAAVALSPWLIWRKPRGLSMANIFVLGAGAGGGGGFGSTAGAARGGGGGGGSGAQMTLTIPLFMLPDILYVFAPAGGLGVTSSLGGSGQLAYVCAYPNLTSAFNVYCRSGNAAAVGGGTGTGAAVGAAGTAGTIVTTSTIPLARQGQFGSIAGQIGLAGGAVAGASPSPQTWPNTGICAMGGNGGAGTTSADFAGGSTTALTGGGWIQEAIPVAQAAGSVNGSDGINLGWIWGAINTPFFCLAGNGGGSSNSTVGGIGGRGGYGCGGSGGGGGVTTGGRGGDGGPALVIINCW